MQTKAGNCFINFNKTPIDFDNLNFYQASVMFALLARVEPDARKKLYETVGRYKTLMDGVCTADEQQVISLDGEKELLPAPAGMAVIIFDEAYPVCYVFNRMGGTHFDPRYLIVFGGVLRVANDILGFRGIDMLH